MMKSGNTAPKRSLLVFAVLASVLPARLMLAQCSVVSGSTGSNGALAPAPTPGMVTVQLPDSGILNYTTVNIPAGVTVKFQKNAKNTPVFLLATGNVTINGTIDVGGTDASGSSPGVGGPGGYDGGQGGFKCGGGGLGPGGGGPGCDNSLDRCAGSGGFGTAGPACDGLPGSIYGNPVLIPLIGGSGGGGGSSATGFGFGGGGGGGAILVASSGTLTVSGTVSANGGIGGSPGNCRSIGGGGGSGGGVRLIAATFGGNGSILASGGISHCGDLRGGSGRTRIEYCQVSFTGQLPADGTSLDSPRPVFLAGVPTLTITSVGGTAAPANPAGSYSLAPDISLAIGTSVATVQLAATGIPTGTAVAVNVTPQTGQPSTATSSPLAGTMESSTASADVTLAPGRSLISAQVTVTIGGGGAASLVVGSIYGEPIEKVRVDATYGGGSSLTYITASGKEIAADLAGL